MDLMKQYGTNKKKELEGVWEDFSEGIEVKVARHNNPQYKDMLQAIVAKNPRQYRGKKTTDPIMKELQLKCAAKYLLMDWKGVDWKGQKDIAYTPEIGEAVFTELPDFYDDVLAISLTFENYKIEDKEDDIKN